MFWVFVAFLLGTDGLPKTKHDEKCIKLMLINDLLGENIFRSKLSRELWESAI